MKADLSPGEDNFTGGTRLRRVNARIALGALVIHIDSQ
jgi:hypothetical protein